MPIGTLVTIGGPVIVTGVAVVTTIGGPVIIPMPKGGGGGPLIIIGGPVTTMPGGIIPGGPYIGSGCGGNKNGFIVSWLVLKC